MNIPPGAFHALNSPLTPLTVHAQLLQQRLTDAEGLQDIEAIRTATDRLRTLFEDLRLGGRLQANRLAIKLAPQSVGDLVQFWQEHRRVKLRPDGPVPVVGDYDEEELLKIDLNLTAISIEHLVNNGARAANKELTVEITDDDAHTSFHIIDDGKGIDPTAIETLFDPYNETAHSRFNHGAGLGLYIAKGVAQAQGGDLIHNRTNGRTIFTLQLPRLE